ncbi:MAG: hypothetical protein ACQEWW_22850 [Bacillota bacterium]
MEEEYLRTARTLRDEGQIENLERMFFEILLVKILLEIITYKKDTLRQGIGRVLQWQPLRLKNIQIQTHFSCCCFLRQQVR